MVKITLDLEKLSPGWITTKDNKRKHLSSTEAVIRSLDRDLRKALKDAGNNVKIEISIINEPQLVNN
jgi:hypothetical protein